MIRHDAHVLPSRWWVKSRSNTDLASQDNNSRLGQLYFDVELGLFYLDIGKCAYRPGWRSSLQFSDGGGSVGRYFIDYFEEEVKQGRIVIV